MSFNRNNAAVKRIMQEARELANDPCTDYSASPLEDDIFVSCLSLVEAWLILGHKEWHCTIRGPPGTEFEGGLYHFRILLPAEYPFRPPSVMMLTPNGRFELNTKICISFTNYHEELWQPAWGVRTAIVGLQGFFPLKGQAAVGVGALEYPVTERKRLAALSKEWVCPVCQRSNVECLPDPSEGQQAPAEISQSETAPAQEDTKPDLTPGADPRPPSSAPSSSSPANSANETTVPEEIPVISNDAAAPVESVSVAASSNLSSTSTTERSDRPGVSHTGPPVGSPSSVRPPLLLDTAICFCMVLFFALLCRRIF